MRIGEYAVVGELGRGAMGTVYLAESTDGTRVAVKTLPRLDRENAARMRHEVSALRRVRHPAIVQIHDVGETPDGRPFLAMDYLEGGSLLDVLHMHGPLSAGATALVLCDLAQALAVLHESGVVHRDIKPSNVLLRADGSPCLTDLGIALVPGASRHTATGDVIGTLGYTAPEIQDGAPATRAADTFALGVLGYNLLAGHAPFKGDSAAAVVKACADGRCTPLAEVRPEAPVALLGGITAAMSHDPAVRPSDLRNWAHGIRSRVVLERVPTAPSAPLALGDEPTRAVTHRPGLAQLPSPGDARGARSGPAKRRLAVLIGIGAAVVVLLSATAAWAMLRRSGPEAEGQGTGDEVAVDDAQLRTGEDQTPALSQDGVSATTTAPSAATPTTSGPAVSGQTSSGASQASAGGPGGRSEGDSPPAQTTPLAPAPTTTTKPRDPADFNADGFVDRLDLCELLAHYDETGSGLPWDLNGDSTVNVFDMSILLSDYSPGPDSPPKDAPCT